MRLLNQIYGLNVFIKSVKYDRREQKKIREAIALAEAEIKEWKEFLKECKKKIKPPKD